MKSLPDSNLPIDIASKFSTAIDSQISALTNDGSRKSGQTPRLEHSAFGRSPGLGCHRHQWIPIRLILLPNRCSVNTYVEIVMDVFQRQVRRPVISLFGSILGSRECTPGAKVVPSHHSVNKIRNGLFSRNRWITVIARGVVLVSLQCYFVLARQISCH